MKRLWQCALLLLAMMGLLALPAFAQDSTYNAQGALCVNVDFNYIKQIEAQQQAVSDVPEEAQISRPDAVLLIFDTSGSMNERVFGGLETRMDVAKKVLTEYISSFEVGDSVGLRLLGGDCKTTLVRPISPLNNPQRLIDSVNALKPEGFTPIAIALEAALTDLAAVQGSKQVVLVTDGEETCGGDPAATALRIVQSDPTIDVSINVVGFNILDNVPAQDDLRKISRASGGVFISAETGEDFLRALASTERLPFFVTTASTATPVEGLANRSAVPLTPETYIVSIPALSLADQSVSVVRGRGVSLNVDANGEISIIENDPDCIAEFCPQVPLPRLTIGENARVSAQDPRPVNVRNAPGLDGTRIAQFAIGTVFEVLDGPICRDGYLWWNIRSGSTVGWAAEGVPGNYFLEPIR